MKGILLPIFKNAVQETSFMLEDRLAISHQWCQIGGPKVLDFRAFPTVDFGIGGAQTCNFCSILRRLAECDRVTLVDLGDLREGRKLPVLPAAGAWRKLVCLDPELPSHGVRQVALEPWWLGWTRAYP